MEVMCNRVLCYLLQCSVQKKTNADAEKRITAVAQGLVIPIMLMAEFEWKFSEQSRVKQKSSSWSTASAFKL